MHGSSAERKTVKGQVWAFKQGKGQNQRPSSTIPTNSGRIQPTEDPKEVLDLASLATAPENQPTNDENRDKIVDVQVLPKRPMTTSHPAARARPMHHDMAETTEGGNYHQEIIEDQEDDDNQIDEAAYDDDQFEDAPDERPKTVT